MEYKVSDYDLDDQQKEIIMDNSKYLLVVAGAGSGKTLTIIGKVKYLLANNYLPEEILCISFTNEASNSLKKKLLKELGKDISVYTFHKLSLDILKSFNKKFQITDIDMLDNIINNFFYIEVLSYPNFMKMILNYFDFNNTYNVEKTYKKLLQENKKEIYILEKLISTFLKLFKSNNYKLEDFPKFLHKARITLSYRKYKKEKIFLTLALNIYLQYSDYLSLNDEIDFDDMLTKAIEIVGKYGIKKKYKYIIIDEYQDTSYLRFYLIKSIIDKTNANLMVVGDDFQSIYRFSGCSLSLFIDFSNYFQDAKIKKIETTYRNSQNLIKICNKFILKNKKQIPKNLHSNKDLEFPIEIIYYKNRKKSFNKLIVNIYKKYQKPILVLGRNNNDIYKFIDKTFKLEEDGTLKYENNKDIKLRYLTIHKSKGLEEEYVIIINLENDILGMPSKIKNDQILRFVLPHQEKIPYSEERRLFYVALTRTKNKVYLLTNKKNSSIFIEELLNDNKKEIKLENYY